MTSSSRRPSEPGSPGEGDPAPGAVGPGGSAGAAPVGGPRRRGRLRVVLAVLAGVVALLCMGLAGLGYVLYNEETKPDRSAPDVVVSNYLRALLVDRNDTRAATFTCSDAEDLDIQRVRTEMEQREHDFGVVVRASWGELRRTSVGNDRETVQTDLTLAGYSDGQARSRRTEVWEFTVVNEDGWRVCGAERLP